MPLVIKMAWSLSCEVAFTSWPCEYGFIVDCMQHRKQVCQLNELGASDLLSQVRLTAMVTLMVENFFSLMRKDDPMPTQLEYGARRVS